jgi:imidazolonepropionase-like amidohydrolase
VIQWIAAVAIMGATVFTGDGPPLENATVLIDGSRVRAVGVGVAIPADAQRIDAAGRVVTPGLIDGYSRLGLVEFSTNVPSSVEAAKAGDDDPVRAALRAGDSFNSDSIALPIALGGGLTSAVVVPTGGLIPGQSSWVDLLTDDPVRRRGAALNVVLGASGREPGSRARALLRLSEVFEDTRLYRANRGPYIARKLRDLSVSSADLEVLERVTERELRVVISVDRASEIRSTLRLIRAHRLRAILVGAREGWRVADEIASAGVPVLVNPLVNRPESMDSLHSRADNALLLHRAGVDVAFTLRGEVHLAHRLRFAAGNAVADGFPYNDAMAAITSMPARIYGLSDTGVLKSGALANLVVWNGDPLDVTTWPVRVFVRGQSIPLHSRQDRLIERYR